MSSFSYEDAESGAGSSFTYEDATGTQPAKSGPIRRLADVGLGLAKGAVAVPEAAVGIADIASGGRAGQIAERFGFRPKDAKAVLSDVQSPELRAARQQFADADGVLDKAKVAITNPSLIVDTVAESVPSMLGGAVVARQALAAAPRIGAVGAGALGEGVVGAGSAAEQIRQDTPDGTLTPGQSALAAGSGLATGALGLAGGKVAQKLGIGDVDTMLAQGSRQVAAAAPPKGIVRRAAEGAVSEGVLEELPQSVSEQVIQNVALDRPLSEGVADQAVLGTLAGGVMGGAAAAASRPSAPTPQSRAEDVDPTVGTSVSEGMAGTSPSQPAAPAQKPSEAMGIDPAAGPLSRAAADAVDSGAAQEIQAAAAAQQAAEMADKKGGKPEETSDAQQEQPAAAAPLDLGAQPAADQVAPAGAAAAPASPAVAVPPAGDAVPNDAAAAQPGTAGQELPPVGAATAVSQVQDGLDAADQSRAAPPAPRGQFASADDAQAYIRQQRRNGGTRMDALPLPFEDGSYGVALRGTPDFTVAEFDAKQRALRERGVADGDILAKSGEPFKNRLAASPALRKAGEGFAIHAVKDGFVIRKGAADVSEPGATGGLAAGAGRPAGGDDRAGLAAAGPAPDARAGRGADPSARAAPDGQQDLAARDAGGAADAVGLRPATLAESIEANANEAATSPTNDRPEPTDGQKEAGNYRKGHTKVHGLDVTIENPRGSTRSGKRPDGSTWSHEMSDHYGYIRRTVGADDEQVDVYVGPKPESDRVFVVDQINQQTGGFDEHKAMLGYDNQMQAMRAYRANFDKGWKVGPVRAMSVDEFKAWLKGGDTTKPAAQAVSQPQEQPRAEESPQAAAEAQPRQARGTEARADVPNAGEPAAAAPVEGVPEGGAGEEVAPAAQERSGLKRMREARAKKEVGGVPGPAARAGTRAPSAVPAEGAGQRATMESREASVAAAKADAKIEDLGEKIGAARKDTATSTGPRGARVTEDERPPWARRFQVGQIVKGLDLKDEGRWALSDSRSLDWAKRPKRVGRETYATREEAEAAIPLAAVSLKHRAVPTSEGKYEIWRDITDRKRVKVVDQIFNSREDALRYMAEHAVEIIETNSTFGEGDLPAPPDKRRVGPERRTGKVSGEDFMRTFGFRGVEFGNWNNQEERQQLMNDAFDGLLDLADVLNVPPKALSLNGDLALAFGARGQGLSGARAHYETKRAVINLTKENGAGSLAHEWFHAMDHYFGRQDGKAPATWKVTEDGTRTLEIGTTDKMMVSEGFSRASKVREPLRQAFDNVMQTMTKKGITYVEDTEKADRFVGVSREELATALNDIRRTLAEGDRYTLRKTKTATAEQLAEFDAIAKRLVDGDATAMVRDWRSIQTSKTKIAHRWTSDSLEAIGKIYKATTGRSGFDGTDRKGVLDRLGYSIERYSQRLKMLAEAQQGSEKVRYVPTEFAQNAKELDQGRGSDYWTTPPELAARAFQGYVEDKIAERGGVSRFLNYGPENAGILTPWGFKRPYPHGAERKAINAAFDKLVQTVETRTDDAGNVAMFRRAQDDRTDARAESDRKMVEIEQMVDQVTAGWARKPEVIIARHVLDKRLPPEILDAMGGAFSQPTAGLPEGVYFRGKVYLIAQTIDSVERARTVLFHEALGHFGLRSVFGQSLKPILQQVATMRRAEVEAKIKSYGFDPSSEIDRLLAAEEVLAEMAQARPEIGFVQRAVAAIRSWLRAHGLASLKLTDNDIIANYLLPARDFVERGRAADTSPSSTTRAAPALSRAPEGASLQNDRTALKMEALDRLKAIASTPGKLNWWHKTVGTQYNLAQRSPEFKRVFDSVQSFIGDVSRYATEAADMAPRLLPKLESWRDIGKAPISAADNKAISAPIFEGTLVWGRDEAGKPVRMDDLTKAAAALTLEEKSARLLREGHISASVLRMWQGLPIDQYETMVNGKFERDALRAGVVWSDAELKSMFNLTPEQIGLYREFRASTDKSLASLAVADMLRYAGDDAQGIRSMVLDAANLQDAAEMLRDHLLSLAKEQPDRSDLLRDTANGVMEKADLAQNLMDRGYAPLSRFGRYTVDVVTPDGQRQYFGMFDGRIEANRMAAKMRGMFPGAEVSQGTVSEESYKLFSGVSPETLELFGSMVGLEDNTMFQEYLKLAKTSRSAMKRLIERKGIAGFSEDVGRVLASFVYSNARQTSSNLHMGEMKDAAAAIPKESGELKDAAVKLVDYTSTPQEEGQAIRGLLFAQYLGGSIASAMVNLTQTVAMTFPYLSQYGGAVKAGGQMRRAIADALKRGTGDAKLDAALKAAEARGTVAPQEVHQLMAQAQGKGSLQSGDGTRGGNAVAAANNALSRFSLAWGKLFSAAEQFNRRATFIAAYRTAIEQGIADPEAFADKVIAETQGIYNKGNKPAWARGAVGGTIFTFKQYSIAYVELMHRLATRNGKEGKRAAALGLAVLFLMSGAGGLPGEEDLEDLIDALMQRLGYSFNSKHARQQFLTETLGRSAADFIDRGVSGLAGVPIDVSGRLGLGNLIPGTGLLTKKSDYSRDLLEVVGPAGDLGKRAFQAAGQLVDGDPLKAAATVAPTAARNLAKAYDMATTGMYRDDRGRKVIDVDGFDALAKAIGFQPNDVARVQEATGTQQNLIAQVKIREAEIADAWAIGLFERDEQKVQNARDMLARWNENNPAAPIRISVSQVFKRVKAMREDKETRMEKTAPKEIRAAVRAELAGSR